MNIWGKIGSSYSNLLIIPQTKNPTNVGLDIVEKVKLF